MPARHDDVIDTVSLNKLRFRKCVENPDSAPKPRQRVRKLGFQPNDNVFILGSTSAFLCGNDGVQRVRLDEVPYVWMPGALPELKNPVMLAAGVPPLENPFSLMKSVLPGSTLPRFALCVGQFSITS